MPRGLPRSSTTCRAGISATSRAGGLALCRCLRRWLRFIRRDGGKTVYLVNTYDLPSRPLYSLPALTLHESAPGHSWQGAIAMEQQREKKLPQFREDYISAYGEGWALYCERLGTEMGIYHTPYERFGMLSY
jgi:uncharacterized protein (DUF885 family)